MRNTRRSRALVTLVALLAALVVAPAALADPTTPTITGPASPANDNDPRLTGTTDPGTTVRVFTTADCSGTEIASGTAVEFTGAGIDVPDVADDSTTTYYANADDGVTTPSACSAGFAYVEDSTDPGAPTGLATTPPSPANDNDPQVLGTAEAGSTVRLYATNNCGGAIVVSGSAAAFALGLDPPNVANNTSTSYTARAVDAAGNVSACSASVTYVEDSNAPAAPTGLDTVPGSPAQDLTPNVTGTAETNSTVQIYTTSNCTGAVAASGPASTFGGSGITVTVAGNAGTFLSANATDLAGNTSSCSVSIQYVNDTNPPAAPTSVELVPAPPANNNDPRVRGSAEASSTVAVYATANCSGGSVASGSAATFSTGLNPPDVADNSTTTYTARATDLAGNVGACSVAVVYVEDSLAPDTSILIGPSGTTNETTDTFDFASSEPAGATFQCKLDGAVFASCTPPVTLNNLTDGSHTFQMRAIDAAGNVDATPATRTWTVDTSLPQTELGTKPPALINSSSATFTFSSPSHPGATFQCSLDTPVFVPCMNPATFTGLADGPHVLFVRAVNIGIPDPTPAKHIWTVDTTPPETAIDAGPSGTVDQPNATFGFSTNEIGATIQCNLDGAGYAACSSPLVLGGLANGGHVLEVRSTDLAGNVDPSPATRSWTVAVGPPAPPDQVAPGPVTKLRADGDDRRVVLTWTNPVDADVARVEISRTPDGRTVFSGLATTATITGLKNGLLYTFRVTVVDQAGNRSTVATVREAPIVRVLFAPANGKVVVAPPLLAWRPAAKADFYNVQLYRGKRKVLSTWPATAQLRLKQRWRFEGRSQQLAPGVYTWYVWPGFGSPAQAKYGKLLGSSTFVVRRPAAG